MKYAIFLTLTLVFSCWTIAPVGWGVEDYKSKLDYFNPALPVKEVQTVEADDPARLRHEYRMTQERNRLYECLALGIVVIVSLVTVLLFIRKTGSYSAANIINASGLILIIFGTIFLVILSDAESQLSTGIGVMGAIAGYLFGKLQSGEGQGGPAQPGGPAKGETG